MKKAICTLLTTALCLVAVESNAQVFHFFGQSSESDECFRMIRSADGNHLVACAIGNDAAIFKFDCQARAIDSVKKDLALPNSFEAYRDLLELPSGEILAIGTAKVIGSLNHVLVTRYSAQLEELSSDTLRINGLTAEGRAVVRSNQTGDTYIAGIVAGVGLDFGDVFWQKIDPVTLDPIGTATTYSNGIDELSSVSQTADGHFLLAGHSVIGNIFDPEAILNNKPTVRKITKDGNIVWTYAQPRDALNKLGRASFSDAIELAGTGKTVAIGSVFGGASNTIPLDAALYLLSPTGNLQTSASIISSGSQQVFRARVADANPSLFVLFGDSTGNNLNEPGRYFSQIWAVSDNQFSLVSHSIDNAQSGLFPRDFLQKGDDFTATGLWKPQNLSETNLFYVSTTAFSMAITEQSNQTLTAVPTHEADYTYEWIFGGQSISGAVDSIYQPTQNGTYTVVATNSSGCTASATYLFNTANDAQLFWYSVDTLCTMSGTVPYGLVNEAASYAWDFGDGASSTEESPSHFYNDPGTFTVELCIVPMANRRMIKSVLVQSCGQPNLAEVTDLVADPYLVVKDATGQKIYQSGPPLSNQNPPYVLPCALLLEPGKTYEFSVYDADFIGQDDFLGNVQVANAATGGAFSFGVLSIEYVAEDAAASYCWTENLVVIPKLPQPTLIYDAQLDQLVAQPQGWNFTYTWFLNGIGVVGGIDPYSPFLSNPESGNWQVAVTGPHCGAGFSAITPITVATQEPAASLAFGIMPNPAMDRAVLSLDQFMYQEINISLVNTIGKTVAAHRVEPLGQPNFALDLSTHSSGIYFIEIQDEQGRTHTKKLIINKL